MKINNFNIFDTNIVTNDQIQEFVIKQLNPGDYVQLSRLANLQKNLCTPLLNCLVCGLISLSDIANLPILSENKVLEFLDKILVENFMYDFQISTNKYRDYVYSVENGGLGLANDYLQLSVINNRKYKQNYSCDLSLHYEYFFENQAYRSYTHNEEFETEFIDIVLPKILEGFIETSVEDIFPTNPESLFLDIIDEDIKIKTISKYQNIFNFFMDNLTDNNCYKLIVSSPTLISQSHVDPGRFSSILDWMSPVIENDNLFSPYRNTENILNEIASQMELNNEETIEEGSNTFLYLQNECVIEDFSSVSVSRALNRYIVFTEAILRIKNNTENIAQERIAINYIIQKIEDFKLLLNLLYANSLLLQKVKSFNYE
jgi:hypothetical protein